MKISDLHGLVIASLNGERYSERKIRRFIL